MTWFFVLEISFMDEWWEFCVFWGLENLQVKE